MIEGLALSALDWWSEAGVDTLVDDLPRDWLKSPMAPAPVPPHAASSAAPIEPPVPAAPAFPTDLAEYRRWLLTQGNVPGPQAARLDAVGDPASGIVVVVDMPEAEDRAAGSLLSGEVGARFDRMLGMIGLDRTGLYILPFAPARPTTGKVSAGEQAILRNLLDHHLALVGPTKLLLLGDALAQGLFGLPLARGRGETKMVRVGAKDVPAILSFPPRLVAPGATAFRQQARDDLLAFQAL